MLSRTSRRSGPVGAHVPVGRFSPYVENFDSGPGGWYADRYFALPVWDGVAYYGPWWVDANHFSGRGLSAPVDVDLYRQTALPGDSEYLQLPYRGNRLAEEVSAATLPALASVCGYAATRSSWAQVKLLAQ
jgi:hypothetical protein